MLPTPRDFIELIQGLRDAESRRGILLVNSRFQESFHSYAELFARTRAIARRFRADGVGPGHRVVIPLATDIDAIASFLALVHLGATPFSVTAPLIGQDREAHRRQMVRLIRIHRVDRLLVGDELAGIAGAYDEAPASIALSAAAPTPEEIADDSPVEPASVTPGDVAFVQFSSGSTSQPKGVRITHGGIVHNIGLIVDSDRRTSESVWVSWLPLYHDMGLIGGLLTNFLLKNPLVLMHPRCFVTRPIAWLQAISRHRGYVTAIPNFALDICTQRISDEQLRETPLDLSSFRYIYNGSEPVRPGSIRRFEERFARFGFVPGSVRPVYGMAEATLIISAPRFEEPEIVRTIEGMEIPSVGHPLGDFEVRIRDEAGSDLPPGSVGELHIRGTSVTPGYLDATGDASGVSRDGWLATGDLGIRDADGRLFITGRKKDLMIVQGRNFYGHDIAACIEETYALRSGSAYVFSIEREGQEVVVVMLAPAEPPPETLRADIQKLVLREFGLAIHDLHVVQRIPKTTSGKIIRHVCRQMYLDYARP
ncbi:MAG TPA: AMP-binding protein [Candidatus Polarisedimenticolaceae bacterium]|nr:AMP-binding protein [Candidatus Polarisedimenticolaceae bacterium]